MNSAITAASQRTVGLSSASGINTISLGPNASAQSGVVSMPSPPPKPALDKPINSTPAATKNMAAPSGTGPMYGGLRGLSRVDCLQRR